MQYIKTLLLKFYVDNFEQQTEENKHLTVFTF